MSDAQVNLWYVHYVVEVATTGKQNFWHMLLCSAVITKAKGQCSISFKKEVSGLLNTNVRPIPVSGFRYRLNMANITGYRLQTSTDIDWYRYLQYSICIAHATSYKSIHVCNLFVLLTVN